MELYWKVEWLSGGGEHLKLGDEVAVSNSEK